MNYFRLGRLFGIDVHVNWSWLLIFALVSWSLNLTFIQVHPEWSMNVRWEMALLAAFLFFCSVLAHELAHSLVALWFNVPVSNITLFMLGGVSNMQREPSSPFEELAITVVGPLMSLFLGVVCLVIGAGGIALDPSSLIQPSILSHLQPINTTLAWLGSVNLLIGFFNLIPAFPLDGGRIVRSIIWAALRNVRHATRLATWLGQGIAWAMIIGGAVIVFGLTLPVVGSGIFNGLWLILIGAFLNNAALAGYRQSVLDDRLARVQVRSVMQTRVPLIESDAPLGELLRRDLTQPDGYTMFVIQDQEVIGVVAVRDVKNFLAGEWPAATVADVMTPVADLLYVNADEDVVNAFERLQRLDLRHIPVMLNNRIVGLLHRNDIHRLLYLNSEMSS